jgi:CDP-diacylglycerol--glycerol-3-phosphate 3-phosphatidyltransferase
MANAITLSRFPLLFVYIILLYTKNPAIIFWCVPFVVLITMMDMFDGIIARRFGEVSLLGSTLDIAVDRAFEVILWVVYAQLGLISVIIPIIVITRGTLTDAIRAVGMSQGKAAFDQLRHPVSQFLVSSRFMRNIYGLIKGTAFAFVTAAWGFICLEHPWDGWVHTMARILAWITITLTILRGLPVIIEGYSLLKDPPLAKQGPPAA